MPKPLSYILSSFFKHSKRLSSHQDDRASNMTLHSVVVPVLSPMTDYLACSRCSDSNSSTIVPAERRKRIGIGKSSALFFTHFFFCLYCRTALLSECLREWNRLLIIVICTPGGGGDTPLYGLYRYVRPQRVWFFSRFGHK